MSEYQFTFVTTGVEPGRQFDDLDSAFNDEGINVSQDCGRTQIYFFWQPGDTGLDAMKRVHRQLKKTLPDAQVQYVDEDLVSIPDIADRTSLSKKEIRKMADNYNYFPVPVGTLGKGKRVWRWQDIHLVLKEIPGCLNHFTEIDGYGTGDFVDRQDVAAFMLFVDADQKQSTKKAAKIVNKKKSAKKNTR